MSLLFQQVSIKTALTCLKPMHSFIRSFVATCNCNKVCVACSVDEIGFRRHFMVKLTPKLVLKINKKKTVYVYIYFDQCCKHNIYLLVCHFIDKDELNERMDGRKTEDISIFYFKTT